MGLVCAVVGLIAYGSSYEGGLSDFYTNTAQEYSILTGLASGFIVSFLVSIIVSFLTSRSKRKTMEKHLMSASLQLSNHEHEWQKTMSIDNPLNPYITLYKHQLEKHGITDTHVTTDHMSKIFRRAKIQSAIWAGISFCVFIVVIPALALSQDVLTEKQMELWISVCQHWCLVATVLVVVIPPVQEGWQILKQMRSNKNQVLEPKKNHQTKF